MSDTENMPDYVFNGRTMPFKRRSRSICGIFHVSENPTLILIWALIQEDDVIVMDMLEDVTSCNCDRFIDVRIFPEL